MALLIFKLLTTLHCLKGCSQSKSFLTGAQVYSGLGCGSPHRLGLLPLQIFGEANAKVAGVRFVGGIACEEKNGREPAEIA